MSSSASRHQTFNQINITPLTDVMLVLLVIMILLAPLTSNTVLKVAMPQQGLTSKNETAKDRIRISVKGDGAVFFGDKRISGNDCSSIQKQIEAEQNRLGKKDLTIQLEADPSSQQKHVVAVMDAAAGAKISQLNFLPQKD